MKSLTTVNSLSGGKTSSYLSVHYPADIEIFAIVTSDCHNCNTKLKKDKKLLQMINDKIEKHSLIKDTVVSTPEDIKTVKAIFQLEQKIGREIVWVRDVSWEQMMDKRKAIPNLKMRFCTHSLKIKPIFEYLMSKSLDYVDMRIGYRYGEQHRVNTFTTEMKYVDSCNLFGKGRNNWKTKTWRKGSFPLIDDKIIHPKIINYWKNNTEIEFPDDSNCQMCFWKDPQQLRKNFDDNPSIMMWAAIQEEIRGNRFKKEISMLQASNIGLQQDFFFGTGAGCSSGECIS
ncbi:hypothetical protein PL373_13495 [Tenacibaculum maritimum]|nr:hypothetical protein [Tenacibaculum maritimum]MDB0602144.1 hypothetical protein [Tenacibaculum maritimum]MDB0613819.1 hypothetical protein [Tenacibaculum maritimum]